MNTKQILSRFRWFFFRDGFIYVLIISAAMIAVDVPNVVRYIRIRQINDLNANLNISQLIDFSEGKIQASAVNWQRLILYFRTILTYFPSQEVAEMFLGLCEYYGFDQEDLALKYLCHSTDNRPIIFWNAYNTGIIFFKNGKIDQAIYYLERALILPSDKILLAMADSIIYRQILSGISGDYLFNRLTHAREKVLLLLTAAHCYKKEYALAKIFAMKGITEPNIKNREPFYFYAGNIALLNGDSEDALLFFDKAIKAKSNNPLVYRYTANILMKNGRFDDAQKISQIATTLEQSVNLDQFLYPDYLRLEFY
ncbi:MAG: tetratricopeptide repeat protein [Candidatus Omnitrophica bacterium]|nr:tetratricopeptide repeat protein [Candidatus Omnitrophota bacterium]